MNRRVDIRQKGRKCLPFVGRDESAPVSYSVSKLVSALCKKG